MRRFLIISYILTCASPAFAEMPIRDTVIVGNGRYVGQYPTGQGILYSDTNGIIIGNFEYGIAHGVCTHYLKNGNKYHGEFRDGKYSGYGRYFAKNGNVFIGDFKDGTPNGIDTIYYKRRSVYVGECKDGRPHGKGSKYKSNFKTKSYDISEGEFVDGMLHNGFESSGDGLNSVIDGNRRSIGNSMHSQLELSSKYHSLIGLLPKFSGVKLTNEQKTFLKKLAQSD